jgi:hypothetical protein
MSAIYSSAQRTCGTEEHVNHLLQQDKEYAERYRQLTSMKKISDTEKSGVPCSNPIIVPVAVHFNDPVTCDDPTCLLAVVEAQLAVLNAEFAALNPDFPNYQNLNTVCPESYPAETAPVPGIGACVQFCLASLNHPDCSGLSDGDPAITIGKHDWSFASGWEGYLNIFVSGSQGGLGVSPRPGSANGDGFWVTYTAFGAPGFSCTSGVTLNTSVAYGMGRTATHEAGHYFGLPHVFGSCNDSDSNPTGPHAILDTPPQSDSFGGNPTINSCDDVITQCNEDPISFFSYMDYTEDAGYIMFTADQSLVLNWNANNLNFKNNATTCGASYGPIFCNYIAPATCDDGIQNQDEQGIDCGGMVCSPCPTFCGNKFYDESGPCSSYTDETQNTWTFCPDGNEILQVVFNSFDVEERGANDCWDFLLVFDGNSTSAPQIGGEFCGDSVTDAPGGGLVASSVAGGCLTFFFDSDEFVVGEGWDADIFCGLVVSSELTGFSGKHENGINRLSWSTESEINNEGFEILRSRDGINFTTIGTAKGQGNSSKIVNYAFNDIKISKGIKYFYQLKQLDSDGKADHSNIISITVPKDLSKTIKVYPNPASGVEMNIELIGFEGADVEYEILNMQGRLLLSGQTIEGQHQLDTQTLTEGIYLLRIFQDEIHIETKKLVIL